MAHATGRQTEHPIEDLFLARWSPRAFDASDLTDREIQTLFDAARWAPSAFNAQPWRFVYARRNTPDWQRFVGLLLPFNQSWVQHASLLVFVLSDSLIQTKPDLPPTPSHSHSFDAGAAWMLLALQATKLGLAAHGMTGVDFTAVRETLELADRYRVEAAIAVGRRGDVAQLPEALRARETPSARNPIDEIAAEGRPTWA